MALALLVGAFSASAIVACGGDDDAPIVPVETQTAPTDQLDQDAFIDEADSICEEANVAIASLADTSAGDPSTQISEEQEIVEGVIDQIDTLGAPSEDESTLDDFIDAFEELADNLDKQELAAERDELCIVSDQIGVPNWCRSLAEATARLVGDRPSALADRAGVYHLSATGEASWYDFARAIVGDVATPRVVPIATADDPLPARRPAYGVLDTTLFRATFGFALPDWRDALARCLEGAADPQAT